MIHTFPVSYNPVALWEINRNGMCIKCEIYREPVESSVRSVISGTGDAWSRGLGDKILLWAENPVKLALDSNSIPQMIMECWAADVIRGLAVRRDQVRDIQQIGKQLVTSRFFAQYCRQLAKNQRVKPVWRLHAVDEWAIKMVRGLEEVATDVCEPTNNKQLVYRPNGQVFHQARCLVHDTGVNSATHYWNSVVPSSTLQIDESYSAQRTI